LPSIGNGGILQSALVRFVLAQTLSEMKMKRCQRCHDRMEYVYTAGHRDWWYCHGCNREQWTPVWASEPVTREERLTELYGE